MKRIAPVLAFFGLAGLGLVGCIPSPTPTSPTPTPPPTATATATPVPVLNGTYAGVITDTAKDTYSNGAASVTTVSTSAVTVVYSSSNVITLWSMTLPNGTTAVFTSPQVGTSITYTDTVTASGASGTVTDTISQATYTSTASVFSGTSTFANGSTGYTGNGTFVITILAQNGGLKVSVIRSWTILPPSGTPVTSTSITGSGTLTK